MPWQRRLRGEDRVEGKWERKVFMGGALLFCDCYDFGAVAEYWNLASRLFFLVGKLVYVLTGGIHIEAVYLLCRRVLPILPQA